jgi:hypothetical protein
MSGIGVEKLRKLQVRFQLAALSGNFTAHQEWNDGAFSSWADG